jgi:hypothetical protein
VRPAELRRFPAHTKNAPNKKQETLARRKPDEFKKLIFDNTKDRAATNIDLIFGGVNVHINVRGLDG